MRRAKTIPDEEKFRAMLKTRGFRATETRMAVHRAMMSLEHADAERVVKWLGDHNDAAASESSVYNVLEQMATAGIYSFRLSADNKRYFDVCNYSHTHLYDRKNGVFKNLPEDEMREVVLNVLKRHHFRGYTVEDIDIQVVCHPRGSSR